MESFGYVDIYATKGIEYLFVIGFLLAFVAFCRYFTTPQAKALMEKVERRITDFVDWFHVPAGLYFHQGHTWARLEDKEVVSVGMDDFAQKLTGKISALELPAVGTAVRQGEKGWSISLDGRSFDMLAPIEGKVLEFNQEVLNTPEKINRDPYGKGWLMRIQPTRFSKDLTNLLKDNLAIRWMEEVGKRLRAQSNPELGLVLQDGGLPVDGMAKSLSQDGWEQIIKEFFLTSD